MVMLATLTRAIRVRKGTACINTYMNYQAKYDRLISYRQEHPATGYTERHHIVMSSMGGSNDPTNLVVLTGREHWIAHLLLYKIHRNKQTAHACHMLAMRCKERGIPRVRNSRMYEKIRIECAKLTSIRNSKLIGSHNSQYGTRWICNVELRENRKISKDENIPCGWINGRNKWKVNDRDTVRRAVREENRLKRQNECYKKWEDYFYLWQQSNQPIDIFIKKLGYNGASTATQMWKKLNLYTPKRHSALV